MSATPTNWKQNNNNAKPVEKEDDRKVLKGWAPYRKEDDPEEVVVEHMNVLILGKAGTGKSSFINTCHWCLFPELFLQKKTLAKTRDIPGHVTLDVQWCDLTPGIRLIDTKGLITMEDTDELDAVSLLLQGASVNGKAVQKYYKRVSLWQHLFRTRGTLDYHDNIQNPTLQDMPHVLLLVVAANDGIPYGIERIIEIARAQDPIIPIAWLITKGDDKEIEEDEIAMFKKTLLATFGTYDKHMESLVFEIPNYTPKSTEMDPKKDEKSLKLMRTLVQLGTSFFQENQRRKRKQLQDTPPPPKSRKSWWMFG